MYEVEDRGYLTHILVDKQPLAIIYPEEKHFIDSKLQTYEEAQNKITNNAVNPCFKEYESVVKGIQHKNKVASAIINPNLIFKKTKEKNNLANQKVDNIHKRLFAVVQVEKSQSDELSHTHLQSNFIMTSKYLK